MKQINKERSSTQFMRSCRAPLLEQGNDRVARREMMSFDSSMSACPWSAQRPGVEVFKLIGQGYEINEIAKR